MVEAERDGGGDGVVEVGLVMMVALVVGWVSCWGEVWEGRLWIDEAHPTTLTFGTKVKCSFQRS